MIKRKIFEEELIIGMDKELSLKKVAFEKSNNIVKAIDYLNCAAEIFEEFGMQSKSDQILKLLLKIAIKKQADHKEPKEFVFESIKNDKKDNKIQPKRKEPEEFVFESIKNKEDQNKIEQKRKERSDYIQKLIQEAIKEEKERGTNIQKSIEEALEKDKKKEWSETNTKKSIEELIKNDKNSPYVSTKIEQDIKPGEIIEYETLVPEENQDGDYIEYKSILDSKNAAKRKKRNPEKISDRHTKGLTPEKQVKNLKQYGWQFNLSDDQAIDALDIDLENLDFEDEIS